MTGLEIRQWSRFVFGAYLVGDEAGRFGTFLGVVEGDREQAYEEARVLARGKRCRVRDSRVSERASSAKTWDTWGGSAGASPSQHNPILRDQDGAVA